MLSNPPTDMTESEFAVFLQARENRWELVDGMPIMMVRTTQRHADIVANILAALHKQLRARTGVRTGEATIRYPDIVVDCGARDDHGMCATSPVLVCEVLSSSRDPFGTHQRVYKYKAGPDTDYILLVDPDAPRIIVHSREAARWRDRLYVGPDQLVEFPGIGASLSLRDIYDGLEFGSPNDTPWGRSC
jgi:Uma2 family endonuclease